MTGGAGFQQRMPCPLRCYNQQAVAGCERALRMDRWMDRKGVKREAELGAKSVGAILLCTDILSKDTQRASRFSFSKIK